MASHWIREVTTATTGQSTGFPFGSKALAMFLRFVCGFVNQAQEVDRIGVGNSVTVPDGANKQTLYDPEGRFVASDVGRTITVSGMVDPNNNGAFTITDYISATQIRYVNAPGSAETSSFDWVITIASQDYWTSEKSGSNGSINITGADKRFRDTVAGSFAGGDTGKWLLLQDPTNPENSGWYKVTFVDANNVDLDFRSGAAEFPTQNLGAGLSWWLLSDSYQVPDRHGAWWRLETPHANGWALEMKYIDNGSDQGFEIRIAADGSWVGSKFLETTYIGVDNNDTTWFYCVADDAGEFINFFFHNSTNNQYGGFIASNVVLAEPDRIAEEQVALMGCQQSSALHWASTSTYERVNDNSNITRGYIWNDIVGVSRVCIMMDPSYYQSSLSIPAWTGRTANSRTGNWDFINGQVIIVDKDNHEPIGEYEIVGSLQGFFLTSEVATVRTAFDDEATKDRLHVMDGHAVDWPGYTQQH